MSDTTAPYDQVVIAPPGVPARQLSAAQFQALPLHERIRAILQKHVRFYRAGAEIPVGEALRNQ